MSYPTERAAACPICGAKPGNPCYGNGPMPPGSHRIRLFVAYREEIDNLRNRVEELGSSKSKTARELGIERDKLSIEAFETLRSDLLGEIEHTRSNFLPGPSSDQACERWRITAEVLEERALSLREDWGL